ncbi:MAG: 16S rRNA (uracil(1498)-N(3))-methyltransferase [Ketobacteraceae bacterium]|nr:16S rRNA (uracil(1498)-N(3))-methyltransferase [Ketobacteraceae bacterium]
MRNPRIYQPMPISVGDHLQLDEKGSHHVGKVLRMQAGQAVRLFNGEGGEYQATIMAVDKKNVLVDIESFSEADHLSPLPVHLGQVISRGERMDYALQKAVELGVSEITPLYSMRCEVKLSGSRLEKRMQQWQHLIISACEQCGLNRLPEIHPPKVALQWFADADASLKWLLHPGQTPLKLFIEKEPPESVCLAIGPEGGFDDSEVAAAKAAGFQAVAIGPRVLRTETAPIAALSLLQFQWGDF